MNVAQFGPTLHAKAQLFDSSGNLIATAADPNSLSQTLNSTLGAGTYYLAVESFGQYGDVGQYTVSGTTAPVTTNINGTSNGDVIFAKRDADGSADIWLNSSSPDAVELQRLRSHPQMAWRFSA